MTNIISENKDKSFTSKTKTVFLVAWGIEDLDDRNKIITSQWSDNPWEGVWIKNKIKVIFPIISSRASSIQSSIRISIVLKTLEIKSSN